MNRYGWPAIGGLLRATPLQAQGQAQGQVLVSRHEAPADPLGPPSLSRPRHQAKPRRQAPSPGSRPQVLGSSPRPQAPGPRPQGRSQAPSPGPGSQGPSPGAPGPGTRPKAPGPRLQVPGPRAGHRPQAQAQALRAQAQAQAPGPGPRPQAPGSRSQAPGPCPRPVLFGPLPEPFQRLNPLRKGKTLRNPSALGPHIFI